MELWDIYDRQRRTTGRFHVRGTPMGRGEYHLTAFVWVFNRQRELLLTRRAPEKEHYANCWAATGGAALVGETSLQTVRRELREETGIEADEADFHLVRSFRSTPPSVMSISSSMISRFPRCICSPARPRRPAGCPRPVWRLWLPPARSLSRMSAACASCGTNSERFGMPETDGPQAFFSVRFWGTCIWYNVPFKWENQLRL